MRLNTKGKALLVLLLDDHEHANRSTTIWRTNQSHGSPIRSESQCFGTRQGLEHIQSILEAEAAHLLEGRQKQEKEKACRS